MITKDSKGRELEVDVLGEDEADIYLFNGQYTDNGDKVSDEELEYVERKYPDTIYEEWVQWRVSAAEAYWEGDR